MLVVSYIRRFALLPVLFFALTLPSSAVPMNVMVGFGDTAKASAWMPIAVTMTNTSSEDITGTLVAVQVEPKKNTPVCAAAVLLPANSKKLYHVYTKMAGYGANVEVSFVQSNGAVQTNKINVNAATENDKLIVSVGRKSSRLSFLSGEKIPMVSKPDPYGNGPTSIEATIYPTSIAHSALPDKPAGYECADMLILSDFNPSSVRPSVLKAIGMWVASGGTLVVSTGADYKRHQNDFYNDLLPVKITGTTNINGSPSLGSFGGEAFPQGSTAIAMSTAKPGIGRVLLSDSGVPILAERCYGAGKVVFLAMDHLSQPFASWNGQTKFWKNLIKSEPTGPIVATAKGFYENQSNYSYSRENIGPAMANIVAQSADVKTPTISTIGFFLIAYLIVLVPVNYYVLRRKRRLELAWVTTPIIVVAFTLGAYAIGYTMKGGKLQLREAAIVEGSSNTRYARIVTDASLFSPARRRYNLNIEDQFAMAQAMPDDDNDNIPPALMQDTTAINDVPMAMWSSKNFESVSGIDLGGSIETDLILSGGRVHGKITNSTNQTFTDCVVVCGSSASNVGNLSPGQAVNIDISKTSPTQNPNFNQATYQPDLAASLRSYTDAITKSDGRPFLIAKGLKKSSFALSDSATDSQSDRIYIFSLDYGAVGSVNITSEMITATIQGHDKSQQAYNSNHFALNKGLTFQSVQPGGWFVASYHINSPAGTAVQTLCPKLMGTSLPPSRTSAYNNITGKWDRIDCTGPNIDNPAPYISPNNDVRIMIYVPGRNVALVGAVKLTAIAN